LGEFRSIVQGVGSEGLKSLLLFLPLITRIARLASLVLARLRDDAFRRPISNSSAMVANQIALAVEHGACLLREVSIAERPAVAKRSCIWKMNPHGMNFAQSSGIALLCVKSSNRGTVAADGFTVLIYGETAAGKGTDCSQGFNDLSPRRSKRFRSSIGAASDMFVSRASCSGTRRRIQQEAIAQRIGRFEWLMRHHFPGTK